MAEPIMPTDATLTVKALFDAAQLTVSDEEFERFVKLYPALRDQADGIYLSDMEAASPAMAFDPTAAFD
jgi:hypothetical protein